MLKYRVITAIILIPILFLVIIVLPPVYFALLMAFFVGLSAWEWSRLLGFTSPLKRSAYVIFILLGMFLAIWLSTILILFIGLLIWLWAALAVWQYGRERTPLGFQRPEVGVIVGFFVLVACWLSLVTLRIAPSVKGYMFPSVTSFILRGSVLTMVPSFSPITTRSNAPGLLILNTCKGIL